MDNSLEKIALSKYSSLKKLKSYLKIYKIQFLLE